MAKFITDSAFDAQLDYIINNASTMHVCEGQPADYTEATTALGTGAGKSLASVSLAGGDFSKGAGSTDGRAVTVAAQSGISVSQSGDADHIAIVDDTGDELLYVTDMTLQAITSGGSVDVAAFSHTARDASAV